MIAVDTNVVVRLLVADDPRQSAAARELFEDSSIFVAKTVLLETAWVLRSLYRFSDAEILGALGKLLSLENVHVEDGSAVSVALALADQGVELPDALHLTSRPSGAKFMSFDKDFVKRSEQAGVTGISLLKIG